MSIYASIPGIDDEEPCGPPWIYQGSHILPDEDDPRGGTVGLALVPSHITRDGRDDAPEDGRPWPWLRLSIDGSDEPTVLLNPAQARHLAQQLTDWADSAEPTTAPELRDQIAAALHRYDYEHGLSSNPIPSVHHRGEADAVLAVPAIQRALAQAARLEPAIIEQERLADAIARVRALHTPNEEGECRDCCASFDPCPTIAALDPEEQS